MGERRNLQLVIRAYIIVFAATREDVCRVDLLKVNVLGYVGRAVIEAVETSTTNRPTSNSGMLSECRTRK